MEQPEDAKPPDGVLAKVFCTRTEQGAPVISHFRLVAAGITGAVLIGLLLQAVVLLVVSG